MTEARTELPLRILVNDPVPGVKTALQLSSPDLCDLAAPTQATPGRLVFELTVTLAGARPDGGPRLLGRGVHGPPTGRFVYLNWGTYAGDAASPWGRRTKVPLTGIDWPLIEALTPGKRLEASIHGRARDGGPAAASVKLLPPGWTLAAS